MTVQKRSRKNYTYTDYIFEETTVRYVNVDGSVFMLLIPNDTVDRVNDDYFKKVINDGGFPNHMDWFPGSLVHLHLSHHALPIYENSLKYSESTRMLKFASQDMIQTELSETIRTELTTDEGWSVTHILTHYNGENGFEIQTIFKNTTDKNLILEMISSAALDGLSPFSQDDGSSSLKYHTFRGGWAIEGKHICHTLAQMNMEKSWGGSFESEKICVMGTKSIGRYYPYAALEDTEIGCTWGIKLKHNATWQIELSRYGTPLSLSGGIGDAKSGMWEKYVKPGEAFTAPVAYVSVANGGIDEVSNDLIEMCNRDIDAYGEEGMPIIFNDWVTHWGDSSEEKLLLLAEKLKNTKVKYFVTDDGWQKDRVVGDWEVDTTKFPDGFKSYADKIRAMGMIPGIWMEFESVREGSKRYSEEYDDINLSRNGAVIKNTSMSGVSTKFPDFRNPKTITHFDKVLIQFLKDNNIGYLKIDYNAALIGCDGSDSQGQGIIEHMNGVYDYIKRIKREIPDIIIENCAAGGSRLDPKMMEVTAMSSFSDAHESMDLPAIAANMHYLIPPRQSQIWCVLKPDMSKSHMQYVIASGFLGRLCWSGYIDKLNDEQFKMITDAEDFYEKVSHIIKHGRSKIYRTKPLNYRHLIGTQAVVRYSRDKNEILIVCHFFDEPDEFKTELDGKYSVDSCLYNDACTVHDGVLTLNGDARSAAVLKLKKCGI